MIYDNNNDTHYQSRLMAKAKVSIERLNALLGEGMGPSDNCNNCWNGLLTIDEGTEEEDTVKVSVWDWATNPEGYVSVWCSDYSHLYDWTDFLEKSPLPLGKTR